MAIYDQLAGAILPVLSFILGAVFRPFLFGYSTMKGENLATYEDIQMIVAQVKAVTKTTEEIKAEISTGVWDKQKRWGMKRDVLFEATKRIAEVDDAMLSYATVVKEDHAKQKVWATVPPTTGEQLNWAEAKHERQNRWSTVSTAFDESRLFAEIVCGKEGKGAFEELGAFINRLAAQMTKDPNAYESSRADLINKILLTRNAIRKELEVDG
jgi:hypothetical protein